MKALVLACAEAAGTFAWQPEDVAELENMSLVLAADVIYDDGVSLAFMRCMDRFLKPLRNCPGTRIAQFNRV